MHSDEEWIPFRQAGLSLHLYSIGFASVPDYTNLCEGGRALQKCPLLFSGAGCPESFEAFCLKCNMIHFSLLFNFDNLFQAVMCMNQAERRGLAGFYGSCFNNLMVIFFFY